ncbi:MAG: 50S ribosomal protein L19e [Candidatus Pacearchaeota archaeon]
MNLRKKRELAARVLNVGKDRIYFSQANLKEIGEAITRQDILDLYEKGIIKIKEKKGRRKVKRRKRKRGIGSIKKRVVDKKREYIIITRKLRAYLKYLKNKKEISKEKYYELRKKIRAHAFKSKKQLIEALK